MRQFFIFLRRFFMLARKKHQTLLILCECALMVALAVILDLALRFAQWPNGGSVSACAIPIIFLSYRRGWKWGLVSGFVLSGVQMALGFWAPPARTFLAFLAVVFLDYILAFTVLGAAELFAKPFRHKIFAYGFGAFTVSMLRFACSFFSGLLIWPVPDGIGMPHYLYSLVYNGGYMIPNALITTAAIIFLCLLIDPKTLRKPKKD